jgi:hypothetical protein
MAGKYTPPKEARIISAVDRGRPTPTATRNPTHALYQIKHNSLSAPECVFLNPLV